MMGPQPVSASGAKMFKIAFDLELDRPGWPPVSVEHLWGEKTNVKYEVRLVNTPFFVRGVSYGDLVQVRPDHERRELVFDKFKSESGHSTIRIILMTPDARSEIESKLLELGCSWEAADQFASLFAVDIPDEVDYESVLEWLRSCVDASEIEFQESAISSRHKSRMRNSRE